MEPCISVEGLWKKFSVTLGDALKYGLIDTGRRLVGLNKNSGELRPGEFWAVQDVNFEISAGSALGIMGVNGSGKTTLLRILNGSFSPDKGVAKLRGRVGALIAAGAGFSPMLTGRENIFVNGALLGMQPSEIRANFDEIVDFAGLGDFIDMPVRNYSSGMSVRLGFAIATLGRPDILLVDEVIAVGDVAFQRKCYDRILRMRREGTAVLFVSHSVGAVWSLCDYGLFLHKGVSSGMISVAELGVKYEAANNRALALDARRASTGGVEAEFESDVTVLSAETYDVRGEPRSEFDFREPIVIKVKIKVRQKIPDFILRLSFDSAQYRFIAVSDSSYDPGMGIVSLDSAEYIISATYNDQRFRPGVFGVNVSAVRRSCDVHLTTKQAATHFTVMPPPDRLFYDHESPAVAHFDGVFALEAGGV